MKNKTVRDMIEYLAFEKTKDYNPIEKDLPDKEHYRQGYEQAMNHIIKEMFKLDLNTELTETEYKILKESNITL